MSTSNMTAQTAIDFMVLGMPDTEAIKLIKWNRRMLTQTNDELHEDMIAMIIQAIDNTYGEGSYHKYLASGTLPSAQCV